jgi:glycosyltransferase involved in cell wall biosynthesis
VIIFGAPYNPSHAWTAGWGDILEGMRKTGERVEFDPAWDKTDRPIDFDAPLLQSTRAIDMLPTKPYLRSRARNIAQSVPCEQFILRDYIANAHRYWDHIVAGCEWSAEMIRSAGYHSVSVITHGANTETFTPAEDDKPRDRFTIFSGGKMEWRKGQDVAIQAVGYLMQKYSDVELIFDWYNPWPKTAENIRMTRLYADNPDLSTHQIMRKCGIDFGRVRTLQTASATPEEHVADKLQAYRQSDVGIFPNRAEGTPNSMMVDMMACAKPVIALYAHGQRDVLDYHQPVTCTESDDLEIRSKEDGKLQAVWFEPHVDEFIAKLEWAYRHRDALPALGAANRERIKKHAPDVIGRQYVDVCSGVGLEVAA